MQDDILLGVFCTSQFTPITANTLPDPEYRGFLAWPVSIHHINVLCLHAYNQICALTDRSFASELMRESAGTQTSFDCVLGHGYVCAHKIYLVTYM